MFHSFFLWSGSLQFFVEIFWIWNEKQRNETWQNYSTKKIDLSIFSANISVSICFLDKMKKTYKILPHKITLNFKDFWGHLWSLFLLHQDFFKDISGLCRTLSDLCCSNKHFVIEWYHFFWHILEDLKWGTPQQEHLWRSHSSNGKHGIRIIPSQYEIFKKKIKNLKM